MSLRPADWLFLEGLGAEVGHLQGARGTTSEGIRYLIAKERPQRTRNEVRGGEPREEALFTVGTGEGGGPLVRCLNLKTGETHHELTKVAVGSAAGGVPTLTLSTHRADRKGNPIPGKRR